jgi:hypothetical protein
MPLCDESELRGVSTAVATTYQQRNNNSDGGAVNQLIETSCKLVEAIEARAVAASKEPSLLHNDELLVIDAADFERLQGISRLLPVGGEHLASPQRQQLCEVALKLWYGIYIVYFICWCSLVCRRTPLLNMHAARK